jgi:hypothetical protein
MGPAGDHVNCFDLVTGHVKLNRLAGVDIAFLDKSVALNDNESFPL